MKSDISSAHTFRNALRLLAFGAVVTGFASAQSHQAQLSGEPAVTTKDNVPEAIDRLKAGKPFPADIDLIAKSKGSQAIPDFKKQFDLTQDVPIKASIASALVRLGDTDSAPWNYLVSGVGDALTTSAPSPAKFDSKGKLLPDLSPEFVAWAKARDLATDAALEIEMSNLPAMVANLGDTADPRAIPLLRQALFSSNFMIQAVAAHELAQFQDKASIPLIIEACQQAPAEAAATIARSLIDFDDPKAQSAAKVFRPPHDEK